MIKRFAALAVVISILSLLFAGCGSASSGDTIKIGSIQPISGQISAFGTQSRNAINMAIEEINANGGVLGKKLECVIEDDGADPEKTVNVFKKLVTQDKVVGIVGALTSKCTLAITKEAQQRHIPLITPTSTNDTVTDAGDYIFRACYNDSFQGQVVARFAYSNLNLKTAAIIYDNTNDYSKGLTENFKQVFEQLGGKIVDEENYGSQDKDFSAQITKMKTANPDMIFIPDYYSTVALIAKQVRNQGITVPMMGADGWDEIANNAGDEVDGCYYSNHYSPDSSEEVVQTFVKNYQAKYKDGGPNALAALAYDATYILADAINKAGSTDPEKIKAAMMETDKQFVTGHIKFNDKRNPIKSAVMVQLVKGTEANKPQVRYAATVNP